MKPIPIHITMKLQKNKENILIAATGKEITFKGLWTDNFSTEATEARG